MVPLPTSAAAGGPGRQQQQQQQLQQLEGRLAAAFPSLAAELTRPSFPSSSQSSSQSFSSSSSSSATAAAKPLLLVLAPSANNCLAVASELPRVSQNSTLAKLFARHFKLAEQEKVLRENAGKTRAAVGTPARVDALATAASPASNDDKESPPPPPPPSLDLSAVRLLVLDVSLDAKKRTLLDIPETRGDTWGLFARHGLLERVREGECKVALFDSGAKGKLTATTVGSRFWSGGGRGGGRGFGGGGGGGGRGGGGGEGGGRF